MVAENTDVKPEDQALVQERLLPAIEDVTRRFIEKAASVAEGEGWRLEHAQALAMLGSAPFLEGLLNDVPPSEAVASAIKRGRQMVLGELFKSEIEGGVDRHSAFRNILDLQRRMPSARAKRSAKVPEAWMNEALAQVDVAAAAERSPEDQVMAGMRSIAAAALTDARSPARRSLGCVRASRQRRGKPTYPYRCGACSRSAAPDGDTMRRRRNRRL